MEYKQQNHEEVFILNSCVPGGLCDLCGTGLLLIVNYR